VISSWDGRRSGCNHGRTYHITSILRISQIVISSPSDKETLKFANNVIAFTEQGVAMLSGVLNKASPADCQIPLNMLSYCVKRARCAMGKKDVLMAEIRQVPEPFLEEVLDFVRFIKAKVAPEKTDVTIVSESSLTKDWLRPAEDEAWQNL